MFHPITIVVLNMLGVCAFLSREKADIDKAILGTVLVYDLCLIAGGMSCLIKPAL